MPIDGDALLIRILHMGELGSQELLLWATRKHPVGTLRSAGGSRLSSLAGSLFRNLLGRKTRLLDRGTSDPGTAGSARNGSCFRSSDTRTSGLKNQAQKEQPRRERASPSKTFLF